MPLLLVTMPLVILPMAPGVELNLGNSLIPVTGVVLLLRSMLEGDYLRAAAVFAAGGGRDSGLLPVRYSLGRRPIQFRDGVVPRERTAGHRLWLEHLLRDREATPSVRGRVFCGVLILMMRFFMSFALPKPAFVSAVLTC